MIPIKLKLSGFLSYRDPVEVDFTLFDLACISGQNGAGKSSLLDAITWVLFGIARKTDENLVNSATALQRNGAAEVVLIFEYEKSIFQIKRILFAPKKEKDEKTGKITETKKPAILEFWILDDNNEWRVLTEKSVRATQERIEQTLHLDYETFVNASFFLQGKADQFSTASASDRKRILSSILGLEEWETYKERTAERRKTIESDLNMVEGRLAEINEELAQEEPRKTRLKELESQLKQLETARKAQEKTLELAKRMAASLSEQRKLTDTLAASLKKTRANHTALAERLATRETERHSRAILLEHAAAIEAAYAAWNASRAGLETLETLAAQFREQEKRRQPFLDAINAEQARLEQERQSLTHQSSVISEQLSAVEDVNGQLAEAEKSLAEVEKRLAKRGELETEQAIVKRFREQSTLRQKPLTDIQTEQARLEQERASLLKQKESAETQRGALDKMLAELAEAETSLAEVESQLAKRDELDADLKTRQHRQVELNAENTRLKLEMDELKDRLDLLGAAEGAVCPLCGQPISAGEKEKLIEQLKSDGKQRGDRHRANTAALLELKGQVEALEKQIPQFKKAERERVLSASKVAEISARMDANRKSVESWDSGGAGRLVEVEKTLQGGTFAAQAREYLTRIEKELGAIAKAMGLVIQKGQDVFPLVEKEVFLLEARWTELSKFEQERSRQLAQVAQLTQKRDSLRAEIEKWQKTGQPRLVEVDNTLQSGSFSAEARAGLAAIDAELAALGYDRAAHDRLRATEAAARSSEAEYRDLQAARAAIAPLDDEIGSLKAQLEERQAELDSAEDAYAEAAGALASAEEQIPDLDATEDEFLRLQESENRLNQEVGMARQMVSVLSSRRRQKSEQEARREELALEISRHKQLEKAFGKDGVPALLIEQAIPQIEEKANELLDRLSNGSMSVRFITQATYKDKKRDDLRETLDIVISDPAGTREYEMFSGGEAFRVNFAIRLALSEILSSRTGARLQTLVIDEGFGSQDAQGRQRLIEAINLVKSDFAKILIITHLDELKEAFPNRIEVEKTPRGSSVRVI